MLIGPGGAGKGTLARLLTSKDPHLWLSRSWTTRPRRPGEDDDAYVFVDRAEFEERARSGGFVEFAEFLGNLYGTPWPQPPDGSDVLLEIDLQGARQVLARYHDATVVLLVPPSTDVQRERMLERGDSLDQVQERLAKSKEEIEGGRAIARYVVVNSDIGASVAELEAIVEATRSGRREKDC
ncbi:MAG: guanylate kinase [Actinobacteria bacterium]|nr:guanylate kinase [Actinomycetota bacterium]MCL5444548.1 guanylate kinase [Actinomycetota bacterium]